MAPKATKPKSALVEEAEQEETPVVPSVEEETEATVEVTPAVTEGVPEETPKVVPQAARPVEQVGNPDVSGFVYLSDAEYKGLNDMQREDYIARRSKHELLSGPTTKFIIPLQPGEKPGARETISLNGYRVNVKKGVLVDLPLPLAEIVAEKYQVEMEAGQDKLIDRDEAKVAALS